MKTDTDCKLEGRKHELKPADSEYAIAVLLRIYWANLVSLAILFSYKTRICILTPCFLLPPRERKTSLYAEAEVNAQFC